MPPTPAVCFGSKSPFRRSLELGGGSSKPRTENKLQVLDNHPESAHGWRILPPLTPTSVRAQAGVKRRPQTLRMSQPDPQALCLVARTTPHFVSTHNWFLIKSDFFSHLFRRPVPFGSGKHKSGDRLAAGKANRAEPSVPPVLVGKQRRAGFSPGHRCGPEAIVHGD